MRESCLEQADLEPGLEKAMFADWRRVSTGMEVSHQWTDKGLAWQVRLGGMGIPGDGSAGMATSVGGPGLWPGAAPAPQDPCYPGQATADLLL